MRKEDITQVMEIDREVFPTLWPQPNYRRELENRLARYIVACDEEERVEEPGVKATPPAGFSGLVSRLRQLFKHDHTSANGLTPSARQYIFGFAGLWVMAGEAHITNIAVREKHRRQGIGELLLISLINLATELDASLVTLEVRASNITAQSLYSKYGFTWVGLRRGYYTDNREDAVLMSLENITSAPVQANLQRLKQAHSQKWGIADSVVR
jgi:ribosomal-protein-alanine N-acetyltransferase